MDREVRDTRHGARHGNQHAAGVRAARAGWSTDLDVGRVVDLEVDSADAAAARAEVERMCEQLLANPLIESYEIELMDDEG